MDIKLHLTGYAVAYEPGRFSKEKSDKPGRWQGSLFNQQKHAIADAIEWMRLNATYKPRIFVATTPGFIDPTQENNHIKRLTANLRNGYDMQHCVWVRELTGHGFPHWHFVADLPQFDPVKLSLYWSGLFGADAKNSIRLGTRPNKKTGRRSFWIETPRMAWYMSKYIGKDLKPVGCQRKPYRTFAISKELAQASQPLVYNSTIKLLYTGLHERTFQLNPDQLELCEQGAPAQFNPKSVRWHWTGRGQTYTGFKKKR